MASKLNLAVTYRLQFLNVDFGVFWRNFQEKLCQKFAKKSLKIPIIPHKDIRFLAITQQFLTDGNSGEYYLSIGGPTVPL